MHLLQILTIETICARKLRKNIKVRDKKNIIYKTLIKKVDTVDETNTHSLLRIAYNTFFTHICTHTCLHLWRNGGDKKEIVHVFDSVS